MFQHLASPNATAAAPFPPERTAWLVTLPLVVIGTRRAKATCTGQNRRRAWAASTALRCTTRQQYFEDAAEGAARAIHAANDGTVVHYQNGDGALPFYCQLGVRAGHARRHGAAHGSVPDVEARQRRHAATLLQLQLDQSLDKVRDHLVKHYANVTLAPRQPAGRHLP